MSLPSPNLDDRTFTQLVDACRERIAQSCPDWTDLSPHDPGITLIELFAFLTETMIYRLNRLPEKAYIEFLRLIGVTLDPPAAASVSLRFARARDLEQSLEIPGGTRVALSRSSGSSEAVVFTTDQTAVIPAGESSVDVVSHNCDLVVGELAGIASGSSAISVTAAHPPIIAPTNSDLDLTVGVETGPENLDHRARSVAFQGKRYRIWREVPNFANLGDDRFVYIVDRLNGTITFPPSARMKAESGALEIASGALGEVPRAGSEIRLWYRRGGGASGNVGANAKWSLKDPIPSVEVTNPQAATGGRPAESLENALIRGPQEIHSLERAVTARDYELVAESTSSVSRAKAITIAQFWRYATPGSVETLLVPYVPEQNRVGGQLTAAALREAQSDDARAQVQQALDARKPLGTICHVNWAPYKTVRITARVVAYRQENFAALRDRITEKLHLLVNPLPTPVQREGWRFGEALRAFHVFDSIISEPGVNYVDRVRLIVDEVPGADVTTVACDPFHAGVWYAGSGEILFRSMNDTTGWEPAGRFAGSRVSHTAAHPAIPGLLAAVTRTAEERTATINVSADAGETWESRANITFNVRGLAWLTRDKLSVLMFATDHGLFELAMERDATPIQIGVNPKQPETGLYGVAAGRDSQNRAVVAVTMQDRLGVYLSVEGGQPGTFRHLGLQGEDVRVVAIQQAGVRSFLWVGSAAAGGDGDGCRRWELTGPGDSPDGWVRFSNGWKAGSCFGLAFQGDLALAASHHGGVLRLEGLKNDAQWQTLDFACGLPLRETGRLHPVNTVACDLQRDFVLAGGPEGVYISADRGLHYTSASEQVFHETVTIPQTWLFASGAHEIEVVSEDAAR